MEVRGALPEVQEAVVQTGGGGQLAEVIAQRLRERATRRPCLLVGGVGAGKTAVLVRLSQLLAGQNAVPVPIRLRDASGGADLNFERLAEQRFAEEAPHGVLARGTTPGAGTRRSACSSGAVRRPRRGAEPSGVPLPSPGLGAPGRDPRAFCHQQQALLPGRVRRCFPRILSRKTPHRVATRVRELDRFRDVMAGRTGPGACFPVSSGAGLSCRQWALPAVAGGSSTCTPASPASAV
ncbi:hypothetical protein [Streptomyces soliscabiei]|uniref:hypothetical protein n=1 Tax=Streptomyces soliscabiei TaxID=588897 RepID=UPI0029BE08C1|nr:hypothetical protein [Streptomyces sp. NY05-11A]MDX2682065.1 hypothetical protein [Streptomyces sp. NY05-11A]